jgi:hypothetical protein
MLIILLLVAGAVITMPITMPLVFVTLAAFIYVWTMSYPWLKMVGKWAAKPAHFVTLGVIFIVFFFIVVVMAVLIHPLMLVFALPVLIILFPIELAVIVWLVRVVKWVFFRLSGFIDGIFLAVRLEFIKLKIKTDTLKEGGTKGKLRAFRGEFSGDVDRVRGRVSGKKESGFRGKLEALKGEFTGDVEKTRSKLFRRKQ